MSSRRAGRKPTCWPSAASRARLPRWTAWRRRTGRRWRRLAARPGWRGKEEQLAQTEAGPGGAGGLPLRPRRPQGFHLRQAQPLALPRRRGRAPERGAAARPLVLPAHAETSGARRRPPAAHPGARPPTASTASSATPRRRTGSSGSPWCRRRARRRPSAPPCRGPGRWPAPIAFARDLANSPANEATPAWMEERARELAAGRGLEIDGAGRATSCAPAAWAACSPSAPAPPTRRGWCACATGTAAPASPWSARG